METVSMVLGRVRQLGRGMAVGLLVVMLAACGGEAPQATGGGDVSDADRQELEANLKFYEEALATNPEDVDALRDRGRALLELGRYEEALESLNQAAALKPNGPTIAHLQGQVLTKLERPEEAIAAYRRAVELNPKAEHLHMALGNALLGNKQPEEALKVFDAALQQQPDAMKVLERKIKALLDLERNDQALSSIQTLLAAQPTNPVALQQQGVVFYRQNKFAEAKDSFQQSLDLDSEDGGTWAWQARTLGRLKEYDAAIAAYDRAIELLPDDAKLPEAREELVKAKGG